MMNALPAKPKRGRPPKNHAAGIDVRKLLIRSGIETFTEKNYMTSDINGILKKVGVPKGSFYYYFNSKEQFGLEIIRKYDHYFSQQLDTCLTDTSLDPLARLQKFYQSVRHCMAEYDWQRGCLIGNLGQEATSLPLGYSEILDVIMTGWQDKIETCLREAQTQKQICADIDCTDMAAFFWMGWEGAVMRAKLIRDSKPLDIFFSVFINEMMKTKS